MMSIFLLDFKFLFNNSFFMLTKLSHLIDLMYPKTCFSCNKQWSYLCSTCTKTLKPHSEICPVCQERNHNYARCLSCKKSSYELEGIMIVFQYTWVVKELVATLKYQHVYTIAPWMAHKIALLIATQPIYHTQKQSLSITSVPSHRIRKYRVKGYNQSELLAKEVAKLLSLPYLHTTKRIKRTKSQVKLSRIKRLSNLVWAFDNLSTSSKQKEKESKTIIIIDDITTTWATLLQIAKQIKKQHPNYKIRGAVFARHGV